MRRGHVRADPFFGDEPVGDAVELVADVLDRAASGRDAQEVTGVGAAEPEPDGLDVNREKRVRSSREG